MLLLLVAAAFVAASIQFGGVSERVWRVVFIVGIPGTPIFVLVLAAAGWLSLGLAFSVAMLAVLGQALAFPFIGLRPQRGSRREHLRHLRIDVVLYVSANVLWFAILYWSGSSIGLEGLHFKVDSVFANANPATCSSMPALICSHLTFVEALHYSAGNLLTLGAAGITPLDEFTRFLAILQLEPVFVTAFMLAHR